MSLMSEDTFGELEFHIDPAIANAEERYSITVIASWIVGSHHQGLANAKSDIDVVAVYIQNPLNLVHQNPILKDRITTHRVGKVEVKLISLHEFARYVKNSSSVAFEALFYSTNLTSEFDFIEQELQELFLEVVEKKALVKALSGTMHRNYLEYTGTLLSRQPTYNKTLMIATKYTLLSYLVRTKGVELFYNEPVDLSSIVKEDSEIPAVIKEVYARYNNPEAYHNQLDSEGARLFGILNETLESIDAEKIKSSRSGWKNKEYNDLDSKVDSLVLKYYRDMYFL